MNYLWDTIFKAEKAGISKEELKFVLAKTYSAYMEMSFCDFNLPFEEEMDREVEINPYYRYDKIFKQMFSPDNIEDLNVREEVFDWLIHLIGLVDVNHGMNRQEFYRRFVEKEIEQGKFGLTSQELWNFFSKEEKEYVSSQVVDLYHLNAPVHILKKVIHFVFKYSYIYMNDVEKPEILIYAGVKKLEKYTKKMDFILEMFLPMGYEYRIYWDKHFGIIGNTPTMQLDSIVLY